MPPSPSSVRPVLAALLTALLLLPAALVGAPTMLLEQAAAAPPQQEADAPVHLDLLSVTPTSLGPGGVLEARVEVTNTSPEPLSAVELELRTRTARVTDRAMLAQWQADTDPDTSRSAVAVSTPLDLAPGGSAVLTVRAPAADLGYSEEPYYWGTRRISLTVVADEEPLSALRTFTVWRPNGAEAEITQSVLLPLTAPDPAEAIRDPEAVAASAESGRLADLTAIAHRPDVDWWLDPSLLDPPLLPVQEGAPVAPAIPPQEAPAAVEGYAPEPGSAQIAAALAEAVGERSVIAMPYAQSDLVSLQAADADDLTATVRGQGDRVWQQHGIQPLTTALAVPGEQADEQALEAVGSTGTTAAVLPSSSLRRDPASTVTPSSAGVIRTSTGPTITALAPDPELSAEFSLLTEGSDAEQTSQRLLAETATIASEYTEAPRHLLIMPEPTADLDPEATARTLDAMADAPWISTGRTEELLGLARSRDWTTDPQHGPAVPYALGAVDAADVRPSAPSPDGRWEHLDQARTRSPLPSSALTSAQDTWATTSALGGVMEDGAALSAPRRLALAATAADRRDDPARAERDAADAAALAGRLCSSIEVVPSSGYNVISDTAGVPITISNHLDTPITVRPQVTSDRPLVRIGDSPAVTVPARGQVDATVEVEAVANGEVTLSTVLVAENGRILTEPVRTPLTVNPSWENWTTLVLVIAMGALVVVGVLRARRTGAATRAPAVRGPEDPEELSRTGRSTPDFPVEDPR